MRFELLLGKWYRVTYSNNAELIFQLVATDQSDRIMGKTCDDQITEPLSAPWKIIEDLGEKRPCLD